MMYVSLTELLITLFISGQDFKAKKLQDLMKKKEIH